MKNLTIYRSHPSWTLDLEKLDSNLSIPGKLGYSWKILREGLPYIKVGDNILLCCELQKKLLPASVANAEANDRRRAVEEAQGYKMGKKQFRDLKESVIKELWDRAFVTSKFINVWINTKERLLCIETTSNSLADDVMRRLIMDFGYVGRHLETNISPHRLMLTMLDQRTDENLFGLGRSCILDAHEPGQSISFKNELIDTEEFRNYLNGRVPKKLELTMNDGDLAFTIDKCLVISKIKYTAMTTEQSESETPEDYFDATFTLCAGQCVQIINALVNAMGGDATVFDEKAVVA